MNARILQAQDIAEILLISESQAYTIIRKLNKELEDRGFFVQRGRIPRRYFYQRFYLEEDEEN